MRQFRLVIYFCVGILLGANVVLAHAAFSSASGGGFKPHPGGGAAYTGPGGTVSGGTAQTIESVNVGGKYVGVPYVGPLGAAALEVAILALKASPAKIAGTIALGYLADKGLQLIGDQWMSQSQQSVPMATGVWTQQGCWQVSGCGLPTFSDPSSAAEHACSTYYGTSVSNLSQTTADSWAYTCVGGGGATSNRAAPAAQPCPTDYHESAGACFPDAYVPAGESDWDRVRGVTTPDAVWRDLCQQMAKIGQYCKVDSLTGQPVSTPISEYSTDPQTGKQTRQVAKIIPSPTTSDPLRVEVKIETQTKTVATETTPETEESKADESPDFCTVHPEALACAKLGDPEEAGPLEEKEIGVSSITPTAFASNATCPADVTLPHGAVFSFYWPCRFAVAVKPFLIALSWIVAGMLIIGVARDA